MTCLSALALKFVIRRLELQLYNSAIAIAIALRLPAQSHSSPRDVGRDSRRGSAQIGRKPRGTVTVARLHILDRSATRPRTNRSKVAGHAAVEPSQSSEVDVQYAGN